jgi:nitrogen fixation protein FixH
MSASFVNPSSVGPASVPPKGAPSWRWPVIIVGLLTAHVLFMTWAAMKATGDNNGAVIPDYYAKSMKWDEQKAAQGASDALGWKVELKIGSARDALHQREAAITLTDSFAELVDAETIELTYYHQSRPLETQTITIPAGKGRLFTAPLRVPHSGFYNFTVRANVGEDHYIKQWSQYVPD